MDQIHSANNLLSDLVGALLAAASAFGLSTSAVGRIGAAAPSQEIPSPQDTVSIIRSAVSVVQQLWPEISTTSSTNHHHQQLFASDDAESEERQLLQQQEREKAANDAGIQAVQAVLFDSAHELLRVLWMFVLPPRNPWMAGQTATANPDPSCDIKATAFRAIKALALLCARDESLTFMFVENVKGERGINSITRCLCSAASSSEARSAAAELLIVFTLQLGITNLKMPVASSSSTHLLRQQQASSQQEAAVSAAASEEEDAIDIGLLISATLAEPEEQIRSFVLAAVQCCIVQQQQHQSSGAGGRSGMATIAGALLTSSVVSSLLRLVSSDDSSDVRCVSALALQALLSAVPVVVVSAVRQSSYSPQSPPQHQHQLSVSLVPTDYLAVAEGCASRLLLLLSPVNTAAFAGDFESAAGGFRNNNGYDTSSSSSSSPDAVEEEVGALIQLLESVVQAAAIVGNEQVFVALRQRSMARSIILRSGANAQRYRPEALLQLVRCVRVMLERSPPYASQSPQMCDATTIAALFKLTLSFGHISSLDMSDSNINRSRSSTLAAAAAETQLVLGFVLTFSAEARASAVAELSRTMPMFAGVLRERSLAQLAAVDAASYFLGIELRDEYHALLNDDTLQSLRWNKRDGSLDPDCARMILDGQQLRALPPGMSQQRNQQRAGTSNSNNNNNSGSSYSWSGRSVAVPHRPEMTEHWRSCTMQSIVATPRDALVRRAIILASIVRFVVQSVLRALTEASMQQQQVAKETAMLRASAGMSGNNNSGISSLPSSALTMSGTGLTSTIHPGGVPALDPNLVAQQMLQITAEEELAEKRSGQRDPNDVFVSDHSPSTPDRVRAAAASASTAPATKPRGSPGRFLAGNTTGRGGGSGSLVAAASPTIIIAAASASPTNPTARGQRPAILSSSSAAEQILQRVNTQMYSEFDACIRLVLNFSEHFKKEQQQYGASRKAAVGAAATNRFPPSPSATTTASGKLKNPWESKKMQAYDPRAWSIDAVHEGDLFYFSVQVASLNATVLDAIVAKARSHYVELKKVLTVTPNAALNRRHFLLEMVTTVMPHTMALLQKLHKMVASQGEGHVQTALALCPELAQQQQQQSSGSSSSSFSHQQQQQQQDQRMIDCGNVVAVVDFLLGYFAPKLYSMGVQASKPTPSQLQAQKQAAGGGLTPQMHSQQQQQQQQNAASAVGGPSAADFANFSFSGGGAGMDD